MSTPAIRGQGGWLVRLTALFQHRKGLD
jgi:hypothetical protein